MTAQQRSILRCVPLAVHAEALRCPQESRAGIADSSPSTELSPTEPVGDGVLGVTPVSLSLMPNFPQVPPPALPVGASTELDPAVFPETASTTRPELAEYPGANPMRSQ